MKPVVYFLINQKSKKAKKQKSKKNAGYSSDGRAMDCSSIGPVFKSQCPELIKKAQVFYKST